MWEKLITGINNICINLDSSKIVQCRANFIPYKNQEIIDQEEKNGYVFKMPQSQTVTITGKNYKTPKTYYLNYGIKQRKTSMQKNF